MTTTTQHDAQALACATTAAALDDGTLCDRLRFAACPSADVEQPMCSALMIEAAARLQANAVATLASTPAWLRRYALAREYGG